MTEITPVSVNFLVLCTRHLDAANGERLIGPELIEFADLLGRAERLYKAMPLAVPKGIRTCYHPLTDEFHCSAYKAGSLISECHSSKDVCPWLRNPDDALRLPAEAPTGAERCRDAMHMIPLLEAHIGETGCERSIRIRNDLRRLLQIQYDGPDEPPDPCPRCGAHAWQRKGGYFICANEECPPDQGGD